MRRHLLMMALVLFSSDALSITGKDQWVDIRSSYDVLIKQPAFAAVFGVQGLFNACSTASEFRTKTPIQSCVSYKDNEVCAEFELKHIVISRSYYQSICTKFSPVVISSAGECIEYQNVVATYPTSFNFAVVEGLGDVYGNLIFTKRYTVSPCK